MAAMDRHLSPTEAAKRFGTSVKALRLYEQRGLLTPGRTQNVRGDAGWRIYAPDQIARLHQILAMKHLGLSLARIGRIMRGTDTLEPVLALQEQALSRETEKLSRALALVRAARARLAAGEALSIDDLAALTQETTMKSRLTHKTLFHPALAAHESKHFRPEEIEAISCREDLDQEASISTWQTLIAELKTLAAAGDARSPAALDLGRRMQAQTRAFTRGDDKLASQIRGMVKDAMADPNTAAQLPFTPEHLEFLGKVMDELNRQPG
jgi:DNA-binding transcriptional MerR regulator